MLRDMSSTISPEQVRAEIRKFWQIMCGKSAERLDNLYSPSAVVLTGKARKPEEANVVLARRARQISSPNSGSSADLGPVEVQITEPGIAIASYTYKFHHTRPGDSGSLEKRHTMHGRATQIFQVDAQGALRIVHEHLSAATNPESEKTSSSLRAYTE
jgi:ketosteroid isomerase-like protein